MPINFNGSTDWTNRFATYDSNSKSFKAGSQGIKDLDPNFNADDNAGNLTFVKSLSDADFNAMAGSDGLLESNEISLWVKQNAVSADPDIQKKLKGAIILMNSPSLLMQMDRDDQWNTPGGGTGANAEASIDGKISLRNFDAVRDNAPASSTASASIEDKQHAASAFKSILADPRYKDQQNIDDTFLQQVIKDNPTSDLRHAAEILLGSNGNENSRKAVTELYAAKGGVNDADRAEVDKFITDNPEVSAGNNAYVGLTKEQALKGRPADYDIKTDKNTMQYASDALGDILKWYDGSTPDRTIPGGVVDDTFLNKALKEGQGTTRESAAKILLGLDGNENSRLAMLSLYEAQGGDAGKSDALLQEAKDWVTANKAPAASGPAPLLGLDKTAALKGRPADYNIETDTNTMGYAARALGDIMNTFAYKNNPPATIDDTFLRRVISENPTSDLRHAAEILLGDNGNENSRLAMLSLFGKDPGSNGNGVNDVIWSEAAAWVAANKDKK